MKLFVVNVGANTADEKARGVRSPIFSDDTFEFVPILEPCKHLHGRAGILTYADLPSGTGRASSLADFLPNRVRNYSVHADPEFKTFTYGDFMSARAANLKYAQPGDQLWFLARLWDHNGNRWTGASDFFLIGVIQVAQNVAIPVGTAPSQLNAELRERINQNANYRQLNAGERRAIRVIVGSTTSSCRFQRALRVTPEVAGHIYGGERGSDGLYRRDGVVRRNKTNGNPRIFERLGSITRSIQVFLDSGISDDARYIEALARLATTARASSN
jgi:hypothetical protein